MDQEVVNQSGNNEIEALRQEIAQMKQDNEQMLSVFKELGNSAFKSKYGHKWSNNESIGNNIIKELEKGGYDKEKEEEHIDTLLRDLKGQLAAMVDAIIEIQETVEEITPEGAAADPATESIPVSEPKPPPIEEVTETVVEEPAIPPAKTVPEEPKESEEPQPDENAKLIKDLIANNKY